MDKDLNFSGFLLINKTSGPTSHDVVDFLRKKTGIKKIGHAGTLDPLAEGLLILAIGKESTKKLSFFSSLDKEYQAELKLGEETDTYDGEGKVIKKYFVKDKDIKRKEIKKVLKKFIGEQKQMPPMYSAKKVKGEKLYNLARQDIIIDRQPSLIKINKLKLIKYKWPILKLKINCSPGTYIRSLAYDLGLELACGAYLKSLKRTKIGKYKLKKAHSLEKVRSDNWPNLCFKKKI